MAKEIRTSINIRAPRERVWQVLTDFGRYPEWNPFIKSLSGEVAEGNIIKIVLEKMAFTPKVLRFAENTELRWLGCLWAKGLFDGEHRFCLWENADGTTRFEHSERFTGLLVGLFSRFLDRDTKPGFEQMNQALKERAEALVG